MNRVPVLSTASEIGSVSGEPEYTSLSVPSQITSSRSHFNDPANTVPVHCGVVADKKIALGIQGKRLGIRQGKARGGKREGDPVQPPDDLIVARIRDEDRAPFVLLTATDCGPLNPPSKICCVSITTAGAAAAHALEPQRTSARMGAQKNFHFEAEYFGGNGDCITDMATGLLYNFGSVIPSLRGGC